MSKARSIVVAAASAALSLALVAGCESKTDSTTGTGASSSATPSTPATPATPTTPAPSDATAAAKGTAGDASAAASNAAGAAKDAAGTAAAGAKDAAGTAAAGAQDAANTAAATAAPSSAAPATQPAAASDSQAKQYIDQAMAYVKENKYDLAEQALTKAEAMKSSLSPTLQSSLTQARTMLNTAKAGGAAGGLKVPELPGAAK